MESGLILTSAPLGLDPFSESNLSRFCCPALSESNGVPSASNHRAFQSGSISMNSSCSEFIVQCSLSGLRVHTII